MAMKTNIKKIGDTVIVSMDGQLDYEVQEPLKNDLTKLVRQVKTDTVSNKIIFNFENLEFVGSSGISAFVQTLKEVNATAPTKPRYCNVKNEFKRIMNALDDSGLFEFHDNEERAKKSFDQ
jgi:anti-anti-sigma factor